MATVEAVTPWAAVYGTARSGRAKVGRLVEAVNRVIDRRDITTVFQPLVDLETGAVVGYEAFTRGPPESAPEPARRRTVIGPGAASRRAAGSLLLPLNPRSG